MFTSCYRDQINENINKVFSRIYTPHEMIPSFIPSPGEIKLSVVAKNDKFINLMFITSQNASSHRALAKRKVSALSVVIWSVVL